MIFDELTMFEVLHDPLIRLVLRADKVPLGEFAQILEKAARNRNHAFRASNKGDVPSSAPIN